MMKFEPVAEPDDFDASVRQRGREWLRVHPGAARPKDLWSEFRPALADAFMNLCAYSVMCDMNGTVDHFRSVSSDPELAYECSNYRYASGWINSAKGTADTLDPFDVKDDWFEVHLPSLQPLLTDRVPQDIRELAEQTLRRLHLRDDERVVRQRRKWLADFQAGMIPITALRRYAPLVARAVEQQQISG